MFARPAARRTSALPIYLVLALAACGALTAASVSAQEPAGGAPRQPTLVPADDAPTPRATPTPATTPIVPDAKPQATPPAATTPPEAATPPAATPPPAATTPPETTTPPAATPPATTVPTATSTGTAAANVPPLTTFTPLGGPPAGESPPPAAAPAATALPSTVATTPSATPIGGFTKLLLILGVFIGSGVIANSLSGWLRMPDHVWRLFFVTLSILTAVATLYLGWPPKLGVDLQGGINLIYEIKPNPEANDIPGNVVMDQLIGTISKRINPGGIKEVTIRPFGSDRVEIIIPGADEVELDRIKRIISTAGNLEFRIVANHHKYQHVIDAANAQIRREEAENAKRIAAKKGPIPLSNIVTVDREVEGKMTKIELGRWFPVVADEAPRYQNDPKVYAVRTVDVGDRKEVLVLCVKDQYDVTGQYLTGAKAELDTNGKNCVDFRFNSEGAVRFSQLTGDNLPNKNTKQDNQLAIILDGYLQSSPVIQSTISNQGQITGQFTKEKVEELAEVLSSGSLPTALNREPISEVNTSPSLGDDTIKSAVTAMYVAVGVVVAFMLLYYRFAGLVANIALILNVALTVAFMIMFNAAFTLSGLAGLALTVGMAVDANVLIYERMREELARGATLRMAIRNGFDRASVTIIDANVTTLITAVVLFVIGTDQVKGFAVALTVGLIWNLFTAITVSRLLFEIAERKRWVTGLKFMQLMGSTNFDFIGKRYLCYGASAFVLGAGIVGTVMRGSDLLNIDFTGGVSITAVFEKAPAGGIAEVREKVESKLPEATVQGLKIDEYPAGAGYKIVTSELSRADVETKLKELFGDELAFHHLTVSDVATIAAPPATTPAVGLPGGLPLDGPPLNGPPPNQGSALPVETDELLAAALEESAQSETPAEGAPAPTPTAAAKPTAAATPTAAAPVPTATATAGAAPTPPADAAPPEDPVTPSDDVFVGGTEATLSFAPPINYEKLSTQIRKLLRPDPNLPGTPFDLTKTPGYEIGSARRLGEWNLRLAMPEAEAAEFFKLLDVAMVDEPFFPSSEVIGAAVAGSAQQSAITAMVVSLALVLVYIWFRFQNVAFGFAAIVALAHDVLFTVGCLALSKWAAPFMGFALVEPFKIDLTIVAAILTIIGYSINDTIVIFDRIREVRGKSKHISGDLINLCVNQTLSRTILTSLTVFLVVLILYIWGGPGIHGFAFALVVGTLSGTYSTIYVASPVLLWLHERAGAAAPSTRAATQAS